jgi:hypothetical protein
MASTVLPPTIELCTRPRDGHPCLGRIYRPQPDVIYCPDCGGKEGGATYTLSPAPDVIAAAITWRKHLWPIPARGAAFDPEALALITAVDKHTVTKE